MNELIAAAEQADGFVFGSPVYYAHPSGRILSALDRAFYAGGHAFEHKPGAAVAVARRGGTSTTFDVLNKYFTIKQMPVVASTYWNNVLAARPATPMGTPRPATMRNIGKNMAWLLRCIEAGQAAGINAPRSRSRNDQLHSIERRGHEYSNLRGLRSRSIPRKHSVSSKSVALRCSLLTLRKRR